MRTATTLLFISVSVANAQELQFRLGARQWRHPHSINAVLITPDSSRAITAGRDGVIRIWKLESGEELSTLKGHKDEALCLAISKDGKQLLSGGADETVRLWNLKTHKGVTLHRARGWIRAVDFSPKGDQLAAIVDVGTLLLWKSDVLGRPRSYDLPDELRTMRFAPDGKHLATNGADKAIALWDVTNGKIVKRFGTGRPRDLRFSPDGKTLLACDFDHEITVWNPAQGKLIEKIDADPIANAPRNSITSMAFSPDGKQLVTTGADSDLTFRRTSDWEKVRVFIGKASRTQALTWSPNGKWLIAATGQRLRIWNAQNGPAFKERVGHSGIVNAVSVSPSGKRIATVTSEGVLHLWNSEGKRERAIEVCKHPLNCALFTSDSELITGDGEGHIRIWNVVTGAKKRQWKAQLRHVTGLSLSRDGQTLASCGDDRQIHFWRLRDGLLLRRIRRPGESGFLGVALMKNGAEVAAISRLSLVRAWNRAGEQTQTIEGPTGGCRAVLVTADDRAIVTAGQDRCIRFWETSSGEERHRLTGPQGSAQSLAMTADGAMLASGHEDGSIVVWSRKGEELATLKGHRAAVTSLSFSHRGDRLVSGSRDLTACFWNVLALHRRSTKTAKSDVKPAQLETLWERLKERPGVRAHRAIYELAGSPKLVLPFLRKRMAPVLEKSILSAIKNLDSDRFTVRQQAFDQLKRTGRAIQPYLNRELKKKPSLEKKRRLQKLLKAVTGAQINAVELQALRGVEILERIGSPEAKKILTSLAQGAREASLTREAQEALNRLR